ncbi:tripartite tricarboxylate transporter substrate binding protein [Lampropedia puyangensis]|uniref:Tripartite tricarboxylate transporter substrate binding protein n=1 Tax=Lampropedia puyangensis TaxID=1330072 RepID=A0A4S8FCB3_9BURK|nr:tripartite tricarboxylate transporter substrate binding protein [Lampropedia puyangensis]THU05200.1 tripartite tricarboxylate transporter substrate binding protein [Lampropedia puyangensis]
MKPIRFLQFAGIAACLLNAGLANATDAAPLWPSKSLSLIVPFGPGSSPDTMSRVVADEASKTLGKPIVILNKPGASGNIGTNDIAKAKPDGYTFGVSITGPLVNNPLIEKSLPFNPSKDLQPITLAVHQYNVLVVPKNSPFQSLQELIDAAKVKDAKLNFPSTGAGTVSHLAVELLLDRTGGQALHVPYPSSPAAVTSLLTGETNFAALPPVAVMPLIKDGRIKPLAVVSTKRLSFLPEVPTVAELGYPGIEGSGWIGFIAPAGISPTTLEKLNRALTDALNNEAVQTRLSSMSMEAAPTTPQAFASYMQEEAARWTPIIQRLDLAEKK